MKFVKSLIVTLFCLFTASVAFAARVNVNAADAQTLADSLNGVGPKTAAAIVGFRKAHGPFKSAEDLMKVKGIGPKILERNRADILLGSKSGHK
jgi:competence protein ComEA